MAQIKEHTVRYSRKVQLEQFEPIEVGESITVELDEGDDNEEVSKELSKTVEDNVERRLMERIMAKKMEDNDDD